MESNNSSNTHQSTVNGETSNTLPMERNRIVYHLGYIPLALIVFIATFISQCVVIPTAGQILFFLVAIGVSIIIIKKCGRIVLHSLKCEDTADATSHMDIRIKRKLSIYYAVLLLILFITVACGSYLNTNYLDEGKATRNQTHFEQIFHIPF